MSQEGYGITSVVAAHTRADRVVDDYATAVAALRDLLLVLPATAPGSCRIVDLVDERVIVHDEGAVAEMLAWANGARRGCSPRFHPLPYLRLYGARPPYRCGHHWDLFASPPFEKAVVVMTAQVVSSGPAIIGRSEMVKMLAAAMVGPDPEICAVDLTLPGAAVLVDRAGRVTRLKYRQDTPRHMAKTG